MSTLPALRAIITRWGGGGRRCDILSVGFHREVREVTWGVRSYEHRSLVEKMSVKPWSSSVVLPLAVNMGREAGEGKTLGG